ncbi:hypothetical protein HAX54_015258 [Datura stramonium]|uniref:LOB domain-containing protein n=1 Tax=Datura stramonium TaxID=4076 RepID=A0ABS8Y556_DATST|nr:hypothetical protein [Datura stramonium]
MSCNGCRVLRKGCSENCILRPCLQSIETPSQGHATIFVAKFFGRAGLMSFISAVPENQRPGLFHSLLYEAVGRTVNPVNGAVGLLWTGNWNVCQAAVETVLSGGMLSPIPEFLGRTRAVDEASECTRRSKMRKRCRSSDEAAAKVLQLADLEFSLPEKRRPGSTSRNSEESIVTTTSMCFENGLADQQGKEPRLLNLFS